MLLVKGAAVGSPSGRPPPLPPSHLRPLLAPSAKQTPDTSVGVILQLQGFLKIPEFCSNKDEVRETQNVGCCPLLFHKVALPIADRKFDSPLLVPISGVIKSLSNLIVQADGGDDAFIPDSIPNGQAEVAVVDISEEVAVVDISEGAASADGVVGKELAIIAPATDALGAAAAKRCGELVEMMKAEIALKFHERASSILAADLGGGVTLKPLFLAVAQGALTRGSWQDVLKNHSISKEVIPAVEKLAKDTGTAVAGFMDKGKFACGGVYLNNFLVDGVSTDLESALFFPKVVILAAIAGVMDRSDFLGLRVENVVSLLKLDATLKHNALSIEPSFQLFDDFAVPIAMRAFLVSVNDVRAKWLIGMRDRIRREIATLTESCMTLAVELDIQNMVVRCIKW